MGEPTQGEAALAEFEALRGEILSRQAAQSNLFIFHLTAAAAVFGFALSEMDRVPLLLALPLSSYLFSWRHALHHLANGRIAEYIEQELSPRVPGGLNWEKWLKDHVVSTDRILFLHPLRLAYPGVAMTGLLGTLIYMFTEGAISSGRMAFLVSLIALGVLVTVENVRVTVGVTKRQYEAMV